MDDSSRDAHSRCIADMYRAAGGRISKIIVVSVYKRNPKHSKHCKTLTKLKPPPRNTFSLELRNNIEVIAKIVDITVLTPSEQ